MPGSLSIGADIQMCSAWQVENGASPDSLRLTLKQRKTGGVLVAACMLFIAKATGVVAVGVLRVYDMRSQSGFPCDLAGIDVFAGPGPCVTHWQVTMHN